MNNDPKNILGKISDFFIEKYRVVYLILVGLILLGGSAYYRLPRESAPEIVLPYGIVMVSYTGAAPNEIEKLITDKIETALDGIDDIKSISSTSSNGLSTVNVEFNPGVDMDEKLQEMGNEISDIENQLPEGSNAPIIKSIETGARPIMTMNVSGDYDLITLKNIAENIQNEIEKIDGIKEVTMVGGLDREINIYVDPSKLGAYNLSMNDIKNVLIKSNINAPGGDLTLDNMQYNIRTVAEFKKISEIENIIVSNKNNNPIFLKDIGRVEDSYAKATSYSEMYVKGVSQEKTVTPSISLSVIRKDNADTIKPSEEIKGLLKDKKGRLYPEDVFVSISGDLALKVDDRLSDVTNNAISGLLIVIVVLFLFIGFRESIIVAFVIPISLLASFVLMMYNDMTFNTVSMLALILALGMLVDNAIVIMENIDRMRDEGLDIVSASKVATNQVAPAVMASTLTTMAAFFPMALMSGIMGEFLKVIPITVMFAIGSSFVMSLVITPALCSRFLSKHKEEKTEKNIKFEMFKNIGSIVLVFVITLYAFSDNGSFGLLSWVCSILFSGAMFLKKFKFNGNGLHELRIIKKYMNLMDIILVSKRRRLGVIFVAIVIFIGSLATIPLGLLKIELMSKTDNTSLSINIETPSGYLLGDTGTVVNEIEEKLYKYPEIKNFVSNVGNTGNSNSIKTASGKDKPNIGKILIDLVPMEERNRTSMEITQQLRKDLKNIAGAEITIEQSQNGPPTGTPISIELTGDNLDELSQTANDFKEILTTINGVIEPSMSLGKGSPEIQVIVNKQRASMLGLDSTTIATEVRNAIQGITVSTFKENQNEVDIIIRTTNEKFNTIRDLEKIYFSSTTGEKIAFSQVASLVETKGVTAIDHEDLDRIVKVEANLSKGFIVNDVLKEFKSQISDYPISSGITISYGGESETTKDSFTELFFNMITAIVLVFIILSIQFNSLSQPLTILAAVPLAIIGVMAGLIITSNNFGMYAFMGAVSLVGIAVNDAIVLVDYTNYLRKNGYDMIDAIKEAGKTRFMPVMATSITTIGGILPLALKDAEYGQMGFALIFGLIASTVLTLVIIPILYSLMEEFKLLIRKRIPIMVQRN